MGIGSKPVQCPLRIVRFAPRFIRTASIFLCAASRLVMIKCEQILEQIRWFWAGISPMPIGRAPLPSNRGIDGSSRFYGPIEITLDLVWYCHIVILFSLFRKLHFLNWHQLTQLGLVWHWTSQCSTMRFSTPLIVLAILPSRFAFLVLRFFFD